MSVVRRKTSPSRLSGLERGSKQGVLAYRLILWLEFERRVRNAWWRAIFFNCWKAKYPKERPVIAPVKRKKIHLNSSAVVLSVYAKFGGDGKLLFYRRNSVSSRHVNADNSIHLRFLTRYFSIVTNRNVKNGRSLDKRILSQGSGPKTSTTNDNVRSEPVAERVRMQFVTTCMGGVDLCFVRW